jgi:diguanylate cyclase (GGDEF)-like protein
MSGSSGKEGFAVVGGVVLRVVSEPRTAMVHLDHFGRIGKPAGGGDRCTVVRKGVTIDRVVRRVLVAAVLAYAVSTLVRPNGTEVPLLDNLLYPALALLAAGLAVSRPLLRSSQRAAWAWLGAAVTAWALGEAYWDVFMRSASTVPVPSWSDVCWLAFHPLAFVGLFRLTRGDGGRIPASAWLDGLVAALGTAALASALLVDAIRDATGGAAISVAVNLAYPLGDVLLLALVVGSSVVGGHRWSRGRAEAALGFLAFAAADAIYLFQSARGTYVEGSLLDVGWLAGLALLASAAWRPAPVDDARKSPTASVSIPTAAAVTSMLLILAGRGFAGRVAFMLALACIATALFRCVLTIREVRSLADSRRLAHTDELTGLGNRRLLWTKLADALESANDDTETLSLLIVDLDDFKEINDTLGHSVGDQLLVEIGARLRSTLREDDVLTRQGGDEFAVVLRDAGICDAAGAAGRLLDQLAEPVVLGDMSVRVRASIGVALAPLHASTADELLQHADVAMYRAKAGRTGFAVYTPGLDERSHDRLRTAGELADGLERGEVIVHYQPVVRVSDGTPVSVEALVRWNHPERGLLAPDQFLAVAAQAGLMRRLTEVVVGTALSDVRAWRGVGIDIPVAVNLSASDVLDLGLPEFISACLAEHDLPGSALLLEIVEDSLMADLDQVRATLGGIRELGVRIAVDDFGTGHSSLARMCDLPVDELKLDRSFVGRMCDDPRPGAIVNAAVQLADVFALTVVAEGVEDARTLAALGEVGCELAQGFYIARPMPFERTVSWLGERLFAEVVSG